MIIRLKLTSEAGEVNGEWTWADIQDNPQVLELGGTKAEIKAIMPKPDTPSPTEPGELHAEG